MKYNKIGRWGMSSLGGILVLIFGFIALAFPNLAIKALAVYFALSILIGGIVLTTYAIQYRKLTPNWKARLAEGIISLILGIVIILNPESAAAFLMIIIGAWAAIIGLVFIGTFFARKTSQMIDVLNLTTGAISLVLGAIIMFNPFGSSRFVVILIGIYAIIYGILTMVFSSKIVNHNED
ncbi:MAG: DUF308 domain-containing protein [Bacteroidales bacterium]|nr:DUF308 domain-containing protein [Bacteroidales bacterium]MDD3892991.1 DUF308 domain-containing protein [Bacteroidales bacterium]